MPTKDPNQGNLELEDDGSDVGAVGEIKLFGGDLRAQDSVGAFNLRQGAASYNSTVHRAEDQLVHDIAEGSFTEYEYTGQRVDAIRVYTSAAKTTKIRETELTYTGNKVTTIVTKQYDAGVLAETYTETVTYSGNAVQDVTGALT